jgi:hypothetical protein
MCYVLCLCKKSNEDCYVKKKGGLNTIWSCNSSTSLQVGVVLDRSLLSKIWFGVVIVDTSLQVRTVLIFTKNCSLFIRVRNGKWLGIVAVSDPNYTNVNRIEDENVGMSHKMSDVKVAS